MPDCDMLASVLRHDLAALSEKCLDQIVPGTEFQTLWHHLAVISELNRAMRRKIRRLVINQPPRTAKSHLVSFVFVVRLLMDNPSAKIALISYDQNLANRAVRYIRQVLQSSWFKKIAPATRIASDKNTEAHFQTTKGGEVRAFSLEGGITGHGFDFIIIDDPMKAIDASSETARRALEEKFRTEIANRWLNPKEGVLILVMQRLHADDFSSFFEKIYPDAERLVIPAIAPENRVYEVGDDRTFLFKKGASIEPDRLPLALLDETRRVQGSATFEAQYQQAPLPSGSRIINPDWFRSLVKPRPRDFRIISIDPAFTDNAGDFSAALVCDLVGDEVEITAGHQVQFEYTELLRWICRLDRNYKPDLFVIETLGSGRGLPDGLSRCGITHVAKVANHKGLSKVQRMEIVSPMIEAGKVWVPGDVEWGRDFLRIIGAFPNGPSDDWPDALSQLLMHQEEIRRLAAMHRARRFPRDLPFQPMPLWQLPGYEKVYI